MLAPSIALSFIISPCPRRVLSCTANITAALEIPGETAGSLEQQGCDVMLGIFTKYRVTGQKKTKHFHSPISLAYLAKCCLIKEREALVILFCFQLFHRLSNSYSHSLSRLSIPPRWQLPLVERAGSSVGLHRTARARGIRNAHICLQPSEKQLAQLQLWKLPLKLNVLTCRSLSLAMVLILAG